MDFSIALVILILKISIKHLDGNYNNQSFIDDIFDAFGEKSGKKLMNLVSLSQTRMDHQLQKNRLEEIGIPESRTDKVIEDVKSLLKCAKITSNMLSDYDCDVDKIVASLLNEYSGQIGIKGDDIAINDTRNALYQIIQEQVLLVQNDSEFINRIIIDIRRIMKEQSSTLKGIDKTVKSSYIESKEANRKLDLITEILTDTQQMMKASFLSSKNKMVDEADYWQPSKKEESVSVDSDITSSLIDLMKKDEEGR